MSVPRTAGFTLIELLITVAIVGILASVAVPFGEVVVQRVKEQELRSALRDIRSALDAYKRATEEGRIQKRADESGYPPTLDVLVDGVVDLKSATQAKIYHLRRVPRDPFAPSGKFATQSWGKRSYASSADAPVEGADVFDVYSTAEGTGLNGVAYRDW